MQSVGQTVMQVGSPPWLVHTIRITDLSTQTVTDLSADVVVPLAQEVRVPSG